MGRSYIVNRYIVYEDMDAGMAELADAHGSGPCGSNTMRVQVPFSARKNRHRLTGVFFIAYLAIVVERKPFVPIIAIFISLSAFICFLIKFTTHLRETYGTDTS